MIQESSLDWTILRIGVVLDPSILQGKPSALTTLFSVSPMARLEYIHPLDAANAQVGALERSEANGKIFLIAGGDKCQITYRQLFDSICRRLGVPPFPEEAFGQKSYYTDWMDTTSAETLFRFQKHSFDQYDKEAFEKMRWLRRFLWPLRPFLRRYHLSFSRPWSTRKNL